MTDFELLEKALAIAMAAHAGQSDRYGRPYILHPLVVMQRVTGVRQKIVAVLHDVVEDTPWTLEQLQGEGFDREILEAIDSVTKREGEDYDSFVRRSAANVLGRAVKLADLEDNMDIRRMQTPSSDDTARLTKYLRAWRFLLQAP